MCMNKEEKNSHIIDDLIMTKIKKLNSTKENVRGGKLHYSDVGVYYIAVIV